MRALPLILLLTALLTGCADSGPSADDLQQEMLKLAEAFEGRVGIYVRHLGTGLEASVNPDAVFPTASMIKVPILGKVFDRIEKGELEYHQNLTYSDSLLYPGSDILGGLRDGEEILLSKVVMLMLTMSDNTASLWLQDLAGTGTAINEWLEAEGYAATRVNSRTEGRRPDWEQYGWGQTTPREMANLLVAIRRGELVSQPASQEMYRVLTRTYWDDEAISQLPPWVQTASKQGAVSASKSEVVLVNAPSGDYVFCVITDGQSDVRWAADNAGYVLIREVSQLLWDVFEPTSPWAPPADNSRWAGP